MNGRTIPLLAVDGGGTKCLAVLADQKGQMLATGRAGSCNYQGTGRDAALRELTKAIASAKSQLAASGVLAASDFPALPEAAAAGEGSACSVKPEAEAWESGEEPLIVACAVFGLAGLDTEQDRVVIEELVREALVLANVQAGQIVVQNDGLAALLGATGGNSGILIIAGTGSIVYGINSRGDSARAGGWGHRIGDEGSGYWIAKQAMTAVLRGFDGRGAPAALAGKLLSHLSLRTEEELFNWAYSADYSVDKAASLSRVVSEAEREGDPLARTILQEAADELFVGARAVMEKLGMAKEPFSIVLQGGVLQSDTVVRGRLAEAFQALAPQATIDEAKKEPIYGVIAQGLRLLQ